MLVSRSTGSSFLERDGRRRTGCDGRWLASDCTVSYVEERSSRLSVESRWTWRWLAIRRVSWWGCRTGTAAIDYQHTDKGDAEGDIATAQIDKRAPGFDGQTEE